HRRHIRIHHTRHQRTTHTSTGVQIRHLTNHQTTIDGNAFERLATAGPGERVEQDPLAVLGPEVDAGEGADAVHRQQDVPVGRPLLYPDALAQHAGVGATGVGDDLPALTGVPAEPRVVVVGTGSVLEDDLL